MLCGLISPHIPTPTSVTHTQIPLTLQIVKRTRCELTRFNAMCLLVINYYYGSAFKQYS